MTPLARQGRPRGLLRWFLRQPIRLYRWRLGWLMGSRYLLLTHVGRRSGLPRQTVVELVAHDPARDVYYIGSGWGERSEWFRNVMKNPSVTVQVGNRQRAATARRLDDAAARRVLGDYYRDHPTAFRILVRALLGRPFDDSESDWREVIGAMPMLALEARPAARGEAGR